MRISHTQTTADVRLSPIRGCPLAHHGSNTWSWGNGSGTRLVTAITSGAAQGMRAWRDHCGETIY
jgi:hypothetical protein